MAILRQITLVTGQVMAGGLALMGLAFALLALEPDGGPGPLRLAPVFVSALLLAIDTP
jgi:hypothetical protein